MKERNLSIDAIKGVAIALVMFGHVFVHNRMEDAYVYDFIRAVQMPLFMIISGYLCGQGRKITDIKTYGRLIGKRARSYMVPFFAWLTIMHLDNLIHAYKTIFVQLDYGLWFLAVLFILTFMVYTAQLAASIVCKSHSFLWEVVFWSIYGGFCLILVLQILKGILLLSPSLTVLYVPFYMIGYVFGNYGKKFFCWGSDATGKLDCKNSHLVQMIALIATALFLFLVVTRNLNCMETKIDTLIQMIAFVLGCTGIIYGILWWKDGRLKNIFAKIGEHTLELYVVHYHFANMLNFSDKQYNFYTLEGFVFVVISFIAMCSATICCIWLIKKVRLLDFLFFGKNA